MTQMEFPPFSLSRLLSTVFAPKGGERVAILIDLDNPKEMANFAFLAKTELEIQRMAHEHFYLGLKNGVMEELKLKGGEMFAYKRTGGSNLDLPAHIYDAQGTELAFDQTFYSRYDIFLCISTESATAPLTAAAKQFGFRGATLHGLNPIILRSGLSVDYNEVSREAEALRAGMTRADWVELDFKVGQRTATLRLELGGQEAQKSHGLCRGGPDVANLPAGEVYYVPVGAFGAFPLQLEDGSMALLHVKDGKAFEAEYLSGNAESVKAYDARLKHDPATGVLGELGFGTQYLPISGRDIQDEKIFGTFHIATGRNDHLGGSLTPDQFVEALNATHDDILYSPEKTPLVEVPEVRMHRAGQTHLLFENYKSAPYLLSLRHGQPV